MDSFLKMLTATTRARRSDVQYAYSTRTVYAVLLELTKASYDYYALYLTHALDAFFKDFSFLGFFSFLDFFSFMGFFSALRMVDFFIASLSSSSA